MSSRFFIIPGNHLPAFITAVYLDKNVTTQYTLSSDPISFPQHCYFRILTCCYIYQCTIPFYWWVISNAVWFSICPFACLSFWLSLLLSNLFSLISNFCWFSWNLLRQLQSWTVLHPFLLLSVDNYFLSFGPAHLSPSTWSGGIFLLRVTWDPHWANQHLCLEFFTWASFPSNQELAAAIFELLVNL